MTPFLRYLAFAVIATVINLGLQRVVLAIRSDEAGFAMALVIGTLGGLVVKYLLDKRWVFDDRSTGLAQNSRKFGLYAALGLITTAIFWGTETAFWLIWQSHSMREAGAVLGLAIGYVIKYLLDRRYVFDAASGRSA